MLTLAIAATAGLRAAAAQTVIVRSAPAGATVEVTLNSGNPVSAKADNFGDATLAVPARTSDSSVQLHVDVCETQVTVHIVARGLQPPAPAAGCTRTDIGSVFIMRPVTTFVADIKGSIASVSVAQGPAPVEWLHRGPGPARSSHWGTPQKGLALSAGAGFSSISNMADRACGNVTSCQTTKAGGTLALGIEYWITRFAAAQVGYFRPHDVTASGSGDTFQFDTRMQSRIFMIGAKAGGAVGPTRMYGLGGMNRHEATITTNQTQSNVTQSFAQKTRGWNWVLGGGVEAWVSPWVAIYGEVTRAKMKGNPTGGGEGGIDDQATFAILGARVRIGR